MEGTIGEIKMFAGNFAPRNQAYCQGQLLAINTNTALFSIIGTIYGGDGRTTMGLPNLAGRTAVHAGRGPGLSDIRQGARGGAETDTINTQTMPNHTHTTTGHIKANDGATKTPSPIDAYIPEAGAFYAAGGSLDIALADNSISVTVNSTGSGQAHNNMPPYLVLNYIICLTGIYPSRS